MGVADQNGYGLRAGQLLFISDAPRGLACGCICVRCGQTLVAKKGLKRRHHFSHLDLTNCVGAAETVLHRLAKELLVEMDELAIPPYRFHQQRRTRSGVLVEYEAKVVAGGKVHINSVRVERSQGDFIPDILIECGAKSLIVEVAVTHKVDRAKLRRIRRQNLPAIEIQLDPDDCLLSRESLKNKLKLDLAAKAWLFHPKQREAERMFFWKLRSAIARERNERRQFRNSRVVQRLRRSAAGDMGGPAISAYDRSAEEFRREHGRYPSAEECLERWPNLWKP